MSCWSGHNRSLTHLATCNFPSRGVTDVGDCAVAVVGGGDTAGDRDLVLAVDEAMVTEDGDLAGDSGQVNGALDD